MSIGHQETPTPDPSDAGFFRWITPLVHSHRRALVQVGLREGLRSDEAFDCVQEAFCNFLLLPDAASLAKVPDDAARLLAVLVRNRARNNRRLHHHARPHVSDGDTLGAITYDGPAVDVLIEQMEEHARLLACVARLAEAQRTVVNLRMLDELPGETVADLLQTTPGNVAVLLHRAKRGLREYMNQGTTHGQGSRS
jgi:RNA polymerase sigma-70 factor (ECF subfamily)